MNPKSNQKCFLQALSLATNLTTLVLSSNRYLALVCELLRFAKADVDIRFSCDVVSLDGATGLGKNNSRTLVGQNSYWDSVGGSLSLYKKNLVMVFAGNPGWTINHSWLFCNHSVLPGWKEKLLIFQTILQATF